MTFAALYAALSLVGVNSLFLAHYLLFRRHLLEPRHLTQFAFAFFLLFGISLYICIVEIDLDYAATGVLARLAYSTLLYAHILLVCLLLTQIVWAVWIAFFDRSSRRHLKRLLKWMFPVWLMVSVSGILLLGYN